MSSISSLFGAFSAFTTSHVNPKSGAQQPCDTQQTNAGDAFGAAFTISISETKLTEARTGKIAAELDTISFSAYERGTSSGGAGSQNGIASAFEQLLQSISDSSQPQTPAHSSSAKGGSSDSSDPIEALLQDIEQMLAQMSSDLQNTAGSATQNSKTADASAHHHHHHHNVQEASSSDAKNTGKTDEASSTPAVTPQTNAVSGASAAAPVST